MLEWCLVRLGSVKCGDIRRLTGSINYISQRGVRQNMGHRYNWYKRYHYRYYVSVLVSVWQRFIIIVWYEFCSQYQYRFQTDIGVFNCYKQIYIGIKQIYIGIKQIYIGIKQIYWFKTDYIGIGLIWILAISVEL